MRRIWIFLLLLILVACQEKQATPVPLPTIADPISVQTALFKTQNAPPTGFESIGFNPIDFNLEQLPGWYFEITANFVGQYTDTGAPAEGSLMMKVWQNNLERTRRVTMQFLGEALSSTVTQIEAVRAANDYYLKDASGVCTRNSETAEEIATLSAGRIVGGITLAVPTGIREEGAYQYGFGSENVVVNIFPEPPSGLTITGGEVWLLPAFNVISRFGVTMDVHRAKILFGNEPVTGTLHYQYNLYEISEGEDHPINIAIPNGC